MISTGQMGGRELRARISGSAPCLRQQRREGQSGKGLAWEVRSKRDLSAYRVNQDLAQSFSARRTVPKTYLSWRTASAIRSLAK
jgi:hypothetical protein